MITDMKQTGIPDANGGFVRNRVQLMKPTQATNVGNVAPQTPPQMGGAPQQPAQPPVDYNSQANALLSQLEARAQQDAGVTPGAPAPGGMMPPVATNKDQARTALQKLSRAELSELLDEIASGRLSSAQDTAGDIFTSNPAQGAMPNL